MLQPALDEALKTATRSRLETTLRSICASHPDALKDVESALVDAIKSSAVAGGVKRPRYAVCVNPGCYAEFDVRNNDEKSCDWHTGTCNGQYPCAFRNCSRDLHERDDLLTLTVNSGELGVDDSEDFWADHDSDPDTEFNRDEFPEGFRWNCCELKGDSEEPGCKTGPHKADDGGGSKRRQVGR